MNFIELLLVILIIMVAVSLMLQTGLIVINANAIPDVAENEPDIIYVDTGTNSTCPFLKG